MTATRPPLSKLPDRTYQIINRASANGIDQINGDVDKKNRPQERQHDGLDVGAIN